MEENNLTRLGSSDIKIPKLCIGTWFWEDCMEEEINEVYKKCMESKVNFFDTAEIYGKSEEILGRCINNNQLDNKPIVATKFAPGLIPRPLFSRRNLRKGLKKSLSKLNLEKVDLYQIHFRDLNMNIKKWMNDLADAYEDGLIGAIGVSNYYPEQLKIAYEALDKRGIKLASVQMHYSLLFRKHEFNGLLDLCKELDITFLAYMTLEQGMLTGRYTSENIPDIKFRQKMYKNNLIDKIKPLIDLMREIGEKHGGKPPAQVAINWVKSKGAVPIVGIRKKKHIDNIDVLRWDLDRDDVKKLDEMSKESYQGSVKTMWRD